jgi:agmatinase
VDGSQFHFENPFNFGGLDPESSSFVSARLVILPVPLEQTTSYRGGTKEGPAAIIQASRYMELVDTETGAVPADYGIHTLAPIEARASGPADSLASVGRVARWLLEQGKAIGALGGEHSLTQPLVQAHRDLHPNLSVLQLDAHGDLRQNYQGSPYSHASVMRRIVDMGVPTVGLGIRSLCQEEVDLIRERKLARYSGRDVVRRRIPLSEMLSSLTDEVYVTLDLDGFDPSEAPGVGTPEPGGFGWFDFLDILDALLDRRVVGFDVVELMPLPGNIVTDFLAAKAVYKLAGAVLRTGDKS